MVDQGVFYVQLFKLLNLLNRRRLKKIHHAICRKVITKVSENGKYEFYEGMVPKGLSVPYIFDIGA